MKDTELALEQLSTVVGGQTKRKAGGRIKWGRSKYVNKPLQAEEEHCCSDCDCGSQFCPDCKHH